MTMNQMRGCRGSMGWVLLVGASALTACSHTKSLEPEARHALAQSRGLCPTDLNQAQMIVRDGPDEVAVGFRSRDESKIDEISRRAAEIGEALASVHPAVNEKGELIQHAPAPKPELREMAGTPEGRGVELVFPTTPEQKQVLLANLNDHERMWRNGECPIMTDESVKSRETREWSRVDR